MSGNVREFLIIMRAHRKSPCLTYCMKDRTDDGIDQFQNEENVLSKQLQTNGHNL